MSNLMKLAAASIAALALSACGGGGGGGGGSTPPPTQVTETVTCPTGVTKTSTADTSEAAIQAAKDQCPAVVLSVVPADGSANASPIGLQVVWTADGTLDASSVVDVTVKAGGVNPVAGTVSVAGDTKSFTFAFTGNANYGQSYTATAVGVKDSFGRAVADSTSTFTTASIVCDAPQEAAADGQSCFTPPTCAAGEKLSADHTSCVSICASNQVWEPAGVCAYKMGVQVIGANQLPAGCTSAAQQCWADSVANGTVKFIETTATMVGQNSRPIMFAYFRNTTSMFGVNGLWNVMPFYADDGTSATLDIAGGTSQEIDWVVGNDQGVIIHSGTECAQIAWFPAGDPSGNSNVWTNTVTPPVCPF